MPRLATAVVAVLVLSLGVWRCSDEDADGNTVNAVPDVVGTWTVDFILSADSTVHFSILLSPDSTDTMDATADVVYGGFPMSGIPAYWEAGTWRVAGDSLVVTRTDCAVMDSIALGLPPVFVWDTIACTPSTAKLPINISGTSWTVKFADLKSYIPPGITVPGYADNTDVVLTRQ